MKITSPMRKKSLLTGIALICLIFLSFAPKPRDYQTECVSTNTDGYTDIKIWDAKKGSNYKPDDARRDAIHAILFSGIAGVAGCTTQPPLLNSQEELGKFKKIEKSFFGKKGKWLMFTRSAATETKAPSQLGKNNWKVYQVSLSKNELRKYLEEQQIIKPLNAGF